MVYSDDCRLLLWLFLLHYVLSICDNTVSMISIISWITSNWVCTWRKKLSPVPPWFVVITVSKNELSSSKYRGPEDLPLPLNVASTNVGFSGKCIFWQETSRFCGIFLAKASEFSLNYMIVGENWRELDETHFFCVASKKSVINVVLATLELNMYSVGDLLAKLTILHPNFHEKPDKMWEACCSWEGWHFFAVVWMCQGSWQVSCVQSLYGRTLWPYGPCQNFKI